MKKLPKVLISVLNWNNAPDTINCVNSIKKQDYSNYTLVVIDNCSIDNSPEQLKNELHGIQLIFSKENLGYAGGNELALEWGKNKDFELLWIVNNDAEVKADCLTKLVDAYLKFGNAIYGGISLEPDNETISFGGGFEFDKTKKINYKSYNKYKDRKISEIKNNLLLREVGDVIGANILIPFDVISKFGYIDTDFFMYAEELDYCFKLREKHNIPSYIISDAILIHGTSASFKKSLELKYIGIYYRQRNWHFFQFNHQHKTKYELIRADFPLSKLFKVYCQSIIFGKNYFLKNEDRSRSLAFLHAIIGRSGKFYEPNEYLKY